MTVSIEQCGVFADQKLYEVTLKNQHGLTVSLINFGASIKSILLPSANGLVNILVGLPEVSDYLKSRTYFGATVGRVAGRLPQTIWQFGGHNQQLADNDNGRHKHGGESGLDRQVFDIKTIGHSSVTFETIDPTGHNGYPGNLSVNVTYRLDEDDTLSVSITGRSDAWTLWNPTNHCYFALDGVGTDITQQQVMVSALCYQPVEADMLPTQGWQPLTGTPFDVRKPTDLNQVLHDQHEQIQKCGGLNHAFLLDHEAENSVVLASTINNRRITMKTDAPSVILYSGNHFNHDGVVSDVPKWGGLTMEAQIAPEINSDWSDIALAPNTFSERNIAWHFDY